MIQRLSLRDSDLKELTAKKFETYRHYYIQKIVTTKGRRGGRTEYQIISDIASLKTGSFFERFFRHKKVQNKMITSKCNNIVEDREILNILKANAKGRRITITL